jgi:hypothetical protein
LLPLSVTDVDAGTIRSAGLPARGKTVCVGPP